MTQNRWEDEIDFHEEELSRYPSLCFALGREMSKNGSFCTDIELSYRFLKLAKRGYERELNNGAEFYKQVYQNLIIFLEDSQYDEVKANENAKLDEDDEDLYN